jgi:shikimate dehydrogenase
VAADSFLLGFVGTDATGALGFELHEREAHRHGLRYLCRRVRADAQPAWREGFDALLRACRGFGFSGLSVAAPYRRAAATHVDELSGPAARMHSVDVVLFTADGRTVGHSTAVPSYAAAFSRGLPGVRLGHVVQLGAGDVGFAVAHALRDQGVRHLSVVDPDAGRAEALVEHLNRDTAWADVSPVDALGRQLKQADGLVNALPPSNTGQPDAALLDVGDLHPDLWIFDTSYRPIHTPLLRAGNALGCRVAHGGGALVNETARTFGLVTGRSPHTPRMFADFADLTAGPQAHT